MTRMAMDETIRFEALCFNALYQIAGLFNEEHLCAGVFHYNYVSVKNQWKNKDFCCFQKALIRGEQFARSCRINGPKNTNYFGTGELQRPETLKFLIFFKKTFKKSLTFPVPFVILLKLACEGSHGGAKRTLKTIQKKERAKEEDSEDSRRV